MLPFLRWMFGWEDEADTAHTHSGSSYDNYAIPNNSHTFTRTRTTPPSNYTTYSIPSNTAQTTTTTHSQTSFNFTPKSNTPFVYNHQRETQPKVTVKVDSVISPKITLTEARTNVFPKTLINNNPHEKSSTRQCLSNTSSSNLPFKVLPPAESPKSVSSSSLYGASPSTTASSNLPFKVGHGVLPQAESPISVSASSSFRTSPSTTISLSVTNKLISSRSAASSTISRDTNNKHKWVEKCSTPLYNQQHETTSKVTVKVDSAISPKITHAETSTNVFPKRVISPPEKSSLGQYLSSPSSSLPFKMGQGVSPPVQTHESVSSSSSFGESPPTPISHSLSYKPILSRAAASTTNSQDTKNKYIWVEKGSASLYVIPEDIKGSIKQDIVPGVLKKRLSPQTYKDYFGALLYAEDYYLEKWDGFEMKNVPLKLHEAEIYSRKGKSNNTNNDAKDDKIFVEFKMDSIPEKRPFLLSRDFASVRPCGREVNPFKGIIFRVVKSNIVLVEFGDDFHAQHYSSCKYDVKFSFNRVCLKRAHQAIAAASDMLFSSSLFPECIPRDKKISNKVIVGQKLLSNHVLDLEQVTAVSRICNLNGSPPYLVEGPICVTREKQLSRTGMVVREAVIELCQASPANRILICAPLNSICDVFLRSLRKEVGDSSIFRANAAFRELDDVPTDVLPFCPYKEKDECFLCPSLPQLLTFKVILSTFMSSFRLHNEGIEGGHFSHVFLVDASSSTEPEILVPLTNLTNVLTKVVITGAPGNQSGWVRSNIARQNGLRTSYFDRLGGTKLYSDLNPEFISKLKDVR